MVKKLDAIEIYEIAESGNTANHKSQTAKYTYSTVRYLLPNRDVIIQECPNLGSLMNARCQAMLVCSMTPLIVVNSVEKKEKEQCFTLSTKPSTQLCEKKNVRIRNGGEQQIRSLITAFSRKIEKIFQSSK